MQQQELKGILKRLGLVTGIAGSLLILGACSRPGSGGDSTATPSVAPARPSATRARTATAARTQPPAAPGSTAVPTTTAPGTTPPPPAAVPTATRALPAGERYVVQSGDTLAEIAAQYGVTVDAIVQANRLDNPDLITPGQELIIPNP